MASVTLPKPSARFDGLETAKLSGREVIQSI